MLVDLSEMEAFMKGHIPGASNMHDGEVMPMVKKISKGTDIIMYGPGSDGQTKLINDAAEKIHAHGVPISSSHTMTASKAGPTVATGSTAATAATIR